jgi:hypothetical protein
VTASEFSFLALGLILGVLSGAALVEILRARPPMPREVRLTVAHDAIPRRSSTLADDGFTAPRPEPARGGPADRRRAATSIPPGFADRRTTVRYATAAGAVAVGPAGPGAGTAVASGRAGASMAGAIPIEPARDTPVPGRIMEPALPLTGIPPSDDPPQGAGRPDGGR